MIKHNISTGSYTAPGALRRWAGWASLSALGIGAAISGQYIGWNFGLITGGFWGMMAATLVTGMMYLCLIYCMGELSTAYPQTGGLYTSVRQAFGPLGGFLCGVIDATKYLMAAALLALSMGMYLKMLLPQIFSLPILVLCIYLLFLALNIQGIGTVLKTSFVLTGLALGILFVFYVGVVVSGTLDLSGLFNLQPALGQSGLLSALPFAIWFFLAVEQIPLASEETDHPEQNLPRSLFVSLIALGGLSLLTLILNTGIPGGARLVSVVEAPLVTGYQAVFDMSNQSAILAFVTLAGLAASLHPMIYTVGRILFALARDRYLPNMLANTNRHQVPHLALLAGSVIAVGCAFIINSITIQVLGAMLLNMVIFAALISYLFLLGSYLKLRLSGQALAGLNHRSLGLVAALLGLGLVLVILLSALANVELRPGFLGVLLVMALAFVYFITFRSKQAAAFPLS